MGMLKIALIGDLFLTDSPQATAKLLQPRANW